MRDLHELDDYRKIHSHYGHPGDHGNGYFEIPSGNENGKVFKVIASNGMGWDHVSISLPHRCPTWEEMNEIARMFFKPDETCVQYHVPESEHINCHEFCLHLWRPRRGTPMPRPPAISVGPAP